MSPSPQAGCIVQVWQPEMVKVANYLIERLSKATVTAELLHPNELVSSGSSISDSFG